MTHVKYHTEGIVLKNSPSGESSSHVWLLTKDFGFIAGHAQSIRELASKLRYSLQDFSHAHVDVVYGRNGWKITSAVFIRNFARASHDGALPAGITAISNIRSLLMRLCRGEEKDDVLFEPERQVCLPVVAVNDVGTESKQDGFDLIRKTGGSI